MAEPRYKVGDWVRFPDITSRHGNTLIGEVKRTLAEKPHYYITTVGGVEESEILECRPSTPTPEEKPADGR